MAVPVLKELTHLPVVVDPSHAAGRRALVVPLSLAAAAAGADGIIVEVHPDPEEAICDGPQALRADDFADYAAQGRAAAELAGKQFAAGASRLSALCASRVLGVGLIGGSIGLAARERARGARSRVGRDPERLRAARRARRGRRAARVDRRGGRRRGGRVRLRARRRAAGARRARRSTPPGRTAS